MIDVETTALVDAVADTMSQAKAENFSETQVEVKV